MKERTIIEVPVKRATLLNVSGILKGVFVSILLVTYTSAQKPRRSSKRITLMLSLAY